MKPEKKKTKTTHSDKSAKEASNIFHKIMKASVKGDPQPKKKKTDKKK